jgi:hypothetical protein
MGRTSGWAVTTSCSTSSAVPGDSSARRRLSGSGGPSFRTDRGTGPRGRLSAMTTSPTRMSLTRPAVPDPASTQGATRSHAPAGRLAYRSTRAGSASATTATVTTIAATRWWLSAAAPVVPQHRRLVDRGGVAPSGTGQTSRAHSRSRERPGWSPARPPRSRGPDRPSATCGGAGPSGRRVRAASRRRNRCCPRPAP